MFATASGAASVWRGINTFWPTVLALSLDNMGHDSDVEGFTGHEDCSREVKTQRATATVSQNMLTLLSKCMISEYFYVLPICERNTRSLFSPCIFSQHLVV